MADSRDSPSPVTTPTQQSINKEGSKSLLISSHEQGASEAQSLSTTPTQSQMTNNTIIHSTKEGSQGTINASQQGQGSYLSVRGNIPPAQVRVVRCNLYESSADLFFVSLLHELLIEWHL